MSSQVWETATENLSKAYERSPRLAELERERLNVYERRKGGPSEFWELYRDAKLEELKASLLAGIGWLNDRSWTPKDESGRNLDRNRLIGTGIMVCFVGDDELGVKRPAILIDLPYNQPLFRVFLSDHEDKIVKDVFSTQEVLGRVSELMFDCNDAVQKATGHEGGGNDSIAGS